MNELVEAASRGVAKRANLIKWGGGIAGLAVFSIVGWYAVSGAAALAVLGALYIAVNGVQQFMPAIEQRFRNAGLAALKQAATDNPIETAETVYLDRQDLLRQSEQADKAYLTEVNLLVQRHADYHKKFPEDPTDEADAEIAMHKSAIEERNRIYTENVEAQRQLAKLIEKMKIKYDIALQSLKASKAGNINIGDVYAKLKLETAYVEVMRRSSEASAALTIAQRTSIANRATAAPAQLEAPKASVLEGLATVNPTQVVPVPRSAS